MTRYWSATCLYSPAKYPDAGSPPSATMSLIILTLRLSPILFLRIKVLPLLFTELRTIFQTSLRSLGMWSPALSYVVLFLDRVGIIKRHLSPTESVTSPKRQSICFGSNFVLFKKGHCIQLKNWRPVTLLNTDYKILTKEPTNRLQQHQTATIKGRFINDNTWLLYTWMPDVS